MLEFTSNSSKLPIYVNFTETYPEILTCAFNLANLLRSDEDHFTDGFSIAVPLRELNVKYRCDLYPHFLFSFLGTAKENSLTF